jgi:hypothetical protein
MYSRAEPDATAADLDFYSDAYLYKDHDAHEYFDAHQYVHLDIHSDFNFH